MDFLLGFGPTVLTWSALALLYLGLRNNHRLSWSWLTAGASLVAVAIGWLMVLTVLANLGGAIAFYSVMLGTAGCVLVGVFFVFLLPGRRKLFAPIVAVGIPAFLFLSLVIGSDYSPNRQIEKYGARLAQALDRYHVDHGTYPGQLDALVPNYLNDLRPPQTVWGWLYQAQNDSYTLGYVSWVDRFGYTICMYTPAAPNWGCRNNPNEVFPLGPTPGP